VVVDQSSCQWVLAVGRLVAVAGRQEGEVAAALASR
jgi:hypothetical protein